MNSEALIVKTLISIQELASNVFFSTLSATVEKILSNVSLSCVDSLIVVLDERPRLQSAPSQFHKSGASPTS